MAYGVAEPCSRGRRTAQGTRSATTGPTWFWFLLPNKGSALRDATGHKTSRTGAKPGKIATKFKNAEAIEFLHGHVCRQGRAVPEIYDVRHEQVRLLFQGE